MKARLERGAAAASIVIENGTMYGQNEIASVPNAAAKMTTTIGNGARSSRRRILAARATAATAPMAGETNR